MTRIVLRLCRMDKSSRAQSQNVPGGAVVRDRIERAVCRHRLLPDTRRPREAVALDRLMIQDYQSSLWIAD